MYRRSRGSSLRTGKDSGEFMLFLLSKSGAVVIHDLIIIGFMRILSALPGQGGKALHSGLCPDLSAPSVGLKVVRFPVGRLRLHPGCREMNFMLFFNLFDHNRARRMP